MATEDEAQAAVDSFIGKFDKVDLAKREQLPDRTLAIYLLDLDITFAGNLKSGCFENVRVEQGDHKAQVRLMLSSDDLIAMNEGKLHFAQAWATGQVHLDASFRDLLRLRALA